MAKLTVIYNLPPGADHAEFLKWRTTEHQEENMAMPGIIKSDFYSIQSAWLRDDLPYRYMTEVYFPDMATFRKSFFNPDYQARLAESLKRIVDPLFFVSEEVLSQTTGD